MTDAERRLFVVHDGEGERVGLGRIVLDGSATAGHYSLLELEGRAGVTVPPHVHRDADEVFYVLEGELIVIADGQEVKLGAGGCGVVPRGIAHGHRNEGEMRTRWLTFFAPAGTEGYFRERGAMVRRAQESGAAAGADYAGIDHAAHMELRARYGIELVEGD